MTILSAKNSSQSCARTRQVDTTTVIAAAILLQLGYSSGNETLRWVAGSSDTAPTLSGEGRGGFHYRWVSHSVNAHGHVAFVARTNRSSPEEYGAFLSTQQGLKAIVRTDEPLPEEGSAPGYFRPAEVFLKESGDVVVSGATGILLHRPSSEDSWVLASGMTAPGFGEDENPVISTDFFGGLVPGDRPIGKPAVNEQGKMAFRVVLEGPTITRNNRQALVAGTPGNLSIVMRQGEAVVENAVLRSFVWSRPELNPEGDLLILCFLIPLGEAFILFPHDGGEPRVVAHWSGPAPQLGEPPRFRLSGLGVGGVGRNGWVWFSSQVTERREEGEPAHFSTALWAGPAGAPQLILRTGTPVDSEGFEEGAIHSSFYGVVISSKNEVAFNGVVELPGDRFQAVRWLWQKGQLRALNASAISKGDPSKEYPHFSNDGILWWNFYRAIRMSAPGRFLVYQPPWFLPLPNGDTQSGDVEFLTTPGQSNGINGISPSMASSGWCVFSAVFTRDFMGSGHYVVRVPYHGYAGWTITGEPYSDWDPPGFTLKAPTNFGEWYQFERSVDMKTWMPLGPRILGDGMEQSALDESLPGLQGYYRLRRIE